MLYTLTNTNDDTLAQIAEEKGLRQTDELFLLFALGSQFDHLIMQSLNRLGVYCLAADPAALTAEDVKKVGPTGIILSGGPVSVYVDPPPFDNGIFDLGIPVLGICLGFQLWAQHIGAKVEASNQREFGTHTLRLNGAVSPLFKGLDPHSTTAVLQSHGDQVLACDGLEVLGSTDNTAVAVARWNHLYGVQFHPEVTETVEGGRIFSNFCFEICQAKDVFPAQDTARKKVQELRQAIGSRRVLLALSGGSDSSVVAHLLKEAVGNLEVSCRVRAVYIKGIDRPDDEAHVKTFFGDQSWLELRIVDATDRFVAVLNGKVSMREKRIAMRSVYKEVLEEEASLFKAAFIAQGTLFTDISESGGGYGSGATKAQIKLHHNIDLDFSLPELTPLDDCVKDSARNIGRAIGVPEELLVRHPFPGPGLVIRIEGEVTHEKLVVARQLDDIFISELRHFGLYHRVWQAGVVITSSVTTCTKGDDAVSGLVVVYWAVTSVNGFTAQAADLPLDFHKRVSQRMTNEIREVGATAYRTSGKPPSTIEWG